MKRLIYLADLTHTGQIVASNVFPLGIGLIGANIVEKLPWCEVELFKYPDDLAAALGRRVPDLIGFSNYSWNCNLGQEYARRVKARWPHVVVIAGGPNYGTSPEEHRDYWDRYPWLDFYVMKEGEVATVALLEALEACQFDPGRVAGVPSCHCLKEGRIIEPALAPRVRNLDEFPSPYTAGMMDKFFDGVLIPLTHTTRGCPFQCSFCTEGTEYYDKVAKRTQLEADLEYIGPRVGTVQDLFLSDANFGMFKEDLDKARAIARSQDRFGWPAYVHVSGGKNHKERLLEVAGIVRGSMNVAASLQTTDAAVLKNIRRENISLEALAAVGKIGTKIDANTYAELILNLPGDTRAAHWKSIKDAVNAGLNFLKLYQLIMLPETDMNTPATRTRFGLKTKWRIMPRCFGTYRFFEERFACVECEEMCVAQDSLSFEDYLECRELDLTVEIVHNASMFRELFGLCAAKGLDWFDFLHRFHVKRRQYSPGLTALYDTFREDTVKPLWDSREAVIDFAKAHIDGYVLSQLGENELFKAKAVAFFRLQDELHAALYGEMTNALPDLATYLAECCRFSLLRKNDLLDTSRNYHEHFSYDFEALGLLAFESDPESHRVSSPMGITFSHTAEQQTAMAAYVKQYGSDTLGIGRILMRAHLKRLFRTVTSGEHVVVPTEQHYRRVANIYGD